MIRARLGRLFVASLVATTSITALGLSASQAATTLPVLHLGIDGPFVGCNPVAQRTSSATQLLLSLVLPETTMVQSGAVISPASSAIEQAEVVSLSPMKVVYTLRPHATWSDGRPISIKDFIATWHEGARGSAPTSDQYGLIASITPVTNQNGSIEVLFSKPASGWRDLFNPLMPASTVAGSKTCVLPDPDIDLSGGPYLIASVTPTTATLVVNPLWQGTPPLFSAIIVSLTTPSTIRNLSQPGSAAILSTNNPSLVVGNGVSSLATVKSSSTFSNSLISIDFQTRTGVCKIRQIRVALADLLRRQGLVSVVAGPYVSGMQSAMSHFWTQGMINYSGTATPLTTPAGVNAPLAANQIYDPVLAGHNLHLLGYTKQHGRWLNRHGGQLRISLAVQSSDAWANSVARHLVVQWGGHGIGVSVVHVGNVSQAEKGLRHGQFDAAVVVRPTTPFINETARWYLPSPMGNASALWSGYRDKASTAILSQAEGNMNPQDAATLYQSIDTRLWVTMSSLPIMVEPTFLVTSATLRGVVSDPYPPGLVSMMGQWAIASSSPGN